MMTVCFAPLNILRDMPFKSKQLQSFRKDKCILMILRIPSFLVVLKDGAGINFLANSLVCDPLIREFYTNASLKKEHIECWVRGHEFTLDIEDIDAMLGFEEQNHKGFTSFKDRMLSLEFVQLHLGGHKEGRSLNTTSFPPDLRCLTYIMMYNLYPVKKFSTINNARAIFLIEFRENTYIDISAHLYNIIVESTKITSRSKLVVPNFIMRILHNKGVKTPQHIGLMPPTPPINSQTILRSRIQILRDEHAEEIEEAPPADTETEVEGQ